MLDKQLQWTESFSAKLLAPRLSVMITSVDLAGRVNAAPYSFFMPVSYIPTRVCFSVVHIKHHSRLGFHYATKQSPKEMLKLEQFAAETEDLLTNATEKLRQKNLDIIVANDVSREDAGFESDNNLVKVIYRDGEMEEFPLMAKEEVADQLLERIKELWESRSSSR